VFYVNICLSADSIQEQVLLHPLNSEIRVADDAGAIGKNEQVA